VSGQYVGGLCLCFAPGAAALPCFETCCIISEKVSE
jgi:hypothetical protein